MLQLLNITIKCYEENYTKVAYWNSTYLKVMNAFNFNQQYNLSALVIKIHLANCTDIDMADGTHMHSAGCDDITIPMVK